MAKASGNTQKAEKNGGKDKGAAEEVKPAMSPVEAPGSVQEGGALQKAEKPGALSASLASLMEEDAAQGNGFGKDDVAIPRIVILQALSPQCVKGKPEFMKEASPGMFFDTVNKTLMDGEEGIIIIPITYRRTLLEWKLREDGGGFVKDHGLDESILQRCTKDEKNRDVTPEGNHIENTAEYYVLLWMETVGAAVPMVVSMARTQLKHSRRWNTMMSQLQLPRGNGKGTFNPKPYFRSYKATTIPETNGKDSWFSWKIEPAKNTTELGGDELYLQARAWEEMVNGGKVKAAAHAAEVEPDPANAPM